jgi:uncharacterized membrane protein YfcA
MPFGWELVIILASLLLGSFVFSAVGFGMALAMAPILLLILAPRQVVVLSNAMIVVATVLILFQTWRAFRWRQSWLFIVSGLPPVPLGVLLLSVAAPTALRISIVSLILVIAVLTLIDVRLPAARTRWGAVGFGFTTTLLTTTLSIGGPVAAIYAIEQDWPRETMRATLAVYFLLAGVLGLVLYFLAELIPQDVEYEMAAGVPVVVIGSTLGGWLARRMSLSIFRYAVLLVIVSGSSSLLIRELLRIS